MLLESYESSLSPSTFNRSIHNQTSSSLQIDGHIPFLCPPDRMTISKRNAKFLTVHYLWQKTRKESGNYLCGGDFQKVDDGRTRAKKREAYDKLA